MAQYGLPASSMPASWMATTQGCRILGGDARLAEEAGARVVVDVDDELERDLAPEADSDCTEDLAAAAPAELLA
ncbi:MAG: hypothetical protein QM820_37680 [Minicystis sp.]